LTRDRPGDVFRQFRDHISRLLNQTITDAPLSLAYRKDGLFAQFAFRDDSDFPMVAPLFSRGLFLAVSQQLEVEPQPDETWRLRTMEYNYHLLEGPSPDSRWIIRWEYKSHSRQRNEHPRHHVHLAAVVDTPAGRMDFDKLHLSTGWVTIEEVIRFLIAGGWSEAQGEQLGRGTNKERGPFQEMDGQEYLDASLPD
jgi:hypothetical protein